MLIITSLSRVVSGLGDCFVPRPAGRFQGEICRGSLVDKFNPFMLKHDGGIYTLKDLKDIHVLIIVLQDLQTRNYWIDHALR